MIDVLTETVITLNEARKLLPALRRGKKPHVSTLWRWSLHGVKGVVLETVSVGGTRCTSREALQRFLETLNRDQRSPVEHRRTSRDREAAIRRAEEELRRYGI